MAREARSTLGRVRVRMTRHVWRIMLFGVPEDEQPVDEFERREVAGQHLLYLASLRQ